MKTLKHFINGEYADPQGTADYFDLVSPVTGEVYARSPNAGEADVKAAYSAARRAFQEWKQATPSMRQQALLALADAVAQNVQRLIDTQSQETGQPKHLIASEEVAVSCDQIRFFAGAARCLEGKATGEYLAGTTSSIRREPLGVVGQVTPWNYPLMMAVWKIVPALAAGNAVILKPSDTTPQSTLLLAELAAPLFPKGCINVLLGKADAGARIVSYPGVALVSITGSVRAGIQVAAAASEHLAKAHLELGGKAPVVVFADANLPRAAEHIAMTGFFNAGQDCTAATRVLVEASVHDEFVKLLVEQAKNTVFGDPDNENALYGPLNNSRQLAHVSGFFERLPAHATVQTGGKQAPRPGFYFEPTVITGLKQDDEAIQNEIFGPVITVQPFGSDDEALAMANGVVYGLASSVWTASHSRAQRFSRDLDFGTVWINTHIPLTGEMPHGGFKMSGYGKDLSMYGLEEYTRIKHVMSNHED